MPTEEVRSAVLAELEKLIRRETNRTQAIWAIAHHFPAAKTISGNLQRLLTGNANKEETLDALLGIEQEK